MKIVVLGGTGNIGRLVVDQALAEGHEVTVVTRDATSLTRTDPRLHVEQGNVFDARALLPVVAGHDAVIVTLGGGSKGGIRSPGTAAVIEAMRQTGVRRLVVQSTLGAGDSADQLTFFWKYLMFGALLRRAYADHQEQERITQASDLDWTIVRPAAFVDGPRTGDHLVGFAADTRTTLKIARADVADFLLRQLTDDRWVRRTPGIAYAVERS